MTGTLINAAAIVVGGGLGALLGDRLPVRVRTAVMDTIGVFVVVLGITDALGAFGPELTAVAGRGGVLIVLGSLVVGGVLGELADLEGRLAGLGERIRRLVQRGGGAAGADDAGAPDPGSPLPGGDPRQRFVEGFVVASLVVTVGPLAILGPLQDGLAGDLQLLAVKAVLDGAVVLAFASVFGIGPAFSAVPLLAVQGSVSLAAGAIAPVLTDPMLDALTATGGFLVLAIGLRLLEIREVRVANLLPALVLAPAAVALWPG